jgi:tRNA 2-selenouridine synthase
MDDGKIAIERFLELAEHIPICDVRSPSEYGHGHIPGAINIPLFNDVEREVVGTKYIRQGRIPAIMEGLALTGPKLAEKLATAVAASRERKLLVYCWRGGMRSEAMGWLFSLGGLKCDVLEGGYKAYRNYILGQISEKRRMIVLGGLTGSSKTHILRHLGSAGHQVIDLERLANHKGSAFGALGALPQPSSEQFSNLLFNVWRKFDNESPVWLEDESSNIGTVFMHDAFYRNMQEAPAIVLMMGTELRLPRLIEEYSKYPVGMLNDSILRIRKRLGGDNTRNALDAIANGDFETAIRITLGYYDKAYFYSLKRKEKGNIIYIETDTDDIDINSGKILEAAAEIMW